MCHASPVPQRRQQQHSSSTGPYTNALPNHDYYGGRAKHHTQQQVTATAGVQQPTTASTNDEAEEDPDEDDDAYWGTPQPTAADCNGRNQHRTHTIHSGSSSSVGNAYNSSTGSAFYGDRFWGNPTSSPPVPTTHYDQPNPQLQQQKSSRTEKKATAPTKPQSKPQFGTRRSPCSPPRQVVETRRSPSSSSSHEPSHITIKSTKTNSTKDEIVHFDWYEGQKFSSGSVKYLITKLLGEGTFGRVLEAKVDGSRTVTEQQSHVAIKVIRDVPRYLENAKIEARILQDIRKKDPPNESRCLRMYEAFVHKRKYYCIVTEPLGESLYEFLKSNHFTGYYLTDIQGFAEQCLGALHFLHSIRLAHTDLKPENILLQFRGYVETEPPRPGKAGALSKPYKRPKSPSIKLIDFGNATYHHESHSSIVNTRQYRSPEVILNTGWNESGDLWCLGCILLELYTGELFFSTHENLEHLALMEKLLHPIPQQIIRDTPKDTRSKFFRWDDVQSRYELLFSRQASTKERNHVNEQVKADELMYNSSHLVFSKFCEKLMGINKADRPHPEKALKDAFFTKRFEN